SLICSFTGGYITVNGSNIILRSCTNSSTINITTLRIGIYCINKPCTIYFGPETRLEVRPLP
ncbi:MAG: hypothetical protein KQA34_03160, partial [Candidatus Aenigmarchaeota archaeon]|nr:hypothetical protein [Candidatus Aenigmarchaeota archaeon]